MKKRLLPALLALVMMLGLLPLAAFAVNEPNFSAIKLDYGALTNKTELLGYLNGTYWVNDGSGIPDGVDADGGCMYVKYMNMPAGYYPYFFVTKKSEDEISKRVNAQYGAGTLLLCKNTEYAKTDVTYNVRFAVYPSTDGQYNNDDDWTKLRWLTAGGTWELAGNNGDDFMTVAKAHEVTPVASKTPAPGAISVTETGGTGTVSFTNATVAEGAGTAKIGAPVSFTVTAPEGCTIGSVAVGGQTVSAADGRYSFVMDGATKAVAVTYEAEDPGPVEKPTLTGFDKAPLGDTRTGADKIAAEDLVGTYTVTGTADGTEAPQDYNITVTATDLKAHQNDDDPQSMGYWVGVHFPVPDGWAITGYQRDEKDKVVIAQDSDILESDGSLNAYYNVDDMDGAKTRNVSVFYTKDAAEVEVKFVINLNSVAKYVVPDPTPVTPDGEGNAAVTANAETIKAQIAEAIANADPDGAAAPVVTTEITAADSAALTSGTATVPKAAVEAAVAGEVDYKVAVQSVGSVQLNKEALTAIQTKIGSEASADVVVAKAEDPANAPAADGKATKSFEAKVVVNNLPMEQTDWTGATGGITLSFYVGTGLSNVKLYYVPDDTSEVATEVAGAAYDRTTGYTTATVDHLSVYTAEYDEGTGEESLLKIADGLTGGSAIVEEATDYFRIEGQRTECYVITVTPDTGNITTGASGIDDIYPGNADWTVLLVPVSAVQAETTITVTFGKKAACAYSVEAMFGGKLDLSVLEQGKSYVCQMVKVKTGNAAADLEDYAGAAIVEFDIAADADDLTKTIKVLGNNAGYYVSLYKVEGGNLIRAMVPFTVCE